MLISKFDLYKNEWLDLVFSGRNQSYGAYELRQHYPKVMVRAMLISLATVSIVAFAVEALTRHAVVPVKTPVKMIEIPLTKIIPPKVEEPKPAVLQHQHTVKPPAATAPAIKYVPFVVSPSAPTEPPKAIDLSGKNIGPSDIKGDKDASLSIDIPGKPGDGGDSGTGTSNDPVPISGLERLPEPYGGAEAWSKFLQKHLKYPYEAIENHMQGRVFLTFVVEKDGHLSGFKITRGAGYGMDEEAMRVLKLAPAWKPGIQNGQPVRVQYNIPINFQLGEDQ
jgi:periplasmic protein TonB